MPLFVNGLRVKAVCSSALTQYLMVQPTAIKLAGCAGRYEYTTNLSIAVGRIVACTIMLLHSTPLLLLGMHMTGGESARIGNNGKQ